MRERTPFERRCDAAWKEHPGLDLKLSVHILRRRDELRAYELSHVYVVRDPISDMVKIGRAKSPWNRISSLQTGSPTPLETVLTVPAPKDLEPMLHRFLEADRIQGEWFRPTPKVLVAIELLLSASDFHRAAAEDGEQPEPELTIDVLCNTAEHLLDHIEAAA